MKNAVIKKDSIAIRKTVLGPLWRELKNQRFLQIMGLATVIWLIIFQYIPIIGLQVAFKEYAFNKGIWGSPWVGLQQFTELFVDPNIRDVIINTFAISALKAFLIFPIPVILAISLNEVSHMGFKKIIQTISYFPYFITWSVVALMAYEWLSPSTGFINNLFVSIGVLKEPYLFLGQPNAFWWVSLVLEAWKNVGFGAIIYSAAIAGIDQELYEAAFIDGAGRIQRIFYITLPSILGTIMILFILNMGAMVTGGLYASNMQVSLLLQNPMNYPKSEILDTYVLRVGIRLFRYSFASAVGLLTSTVSMMLLLTTNFISRKITKESLL
jgi:putative aldouronate transport system permease protein